MRRTFLLAVVLLASGTGVWIGSRQLASERPRPGSSGTDDLAAVLADLDSALAEVGSRLADSEPAVATDISDLLRAEPANPEEEPPETERWARYMRANIMRAKHEYASAIAEFRRVLEAEPGNTTVGLDLAWTYFEAGEADSAFSMAARMAELDSTSAEARSLAGRSLLAKGRVKPAMGWLEDALALDPEDSWTRMNLLLVYENANRLEDAVALLEPEIPEALVTHRMFFRRAEMRLALGRAEDALRDLATILEQSPEYPGAEPRFLEILSRIERSDAVRAILERVVAAQPDLERIRRAYAGLLATSDDWRDARPHLDDLMDARPEDGRLRLQSALLLLREGKIEPARARLEEASRLDAADPEPYRWLWRIASEEEDWIAARAAADSLLARDPQDLEAHWFRGLTAYRLDRPEEAMAWIEAVLEAEPGSRQAALLASAVLQEEGRHGDAAGHLRRYLQENETDRFAQFRLGVVLEQSGQFDEAIEQFDRVLALDPEYHQALNYSGYMWIDQGMNLDEAMSRIRRALELDPDNPAYQDSYGWGFYQQGQYRDAIPPLRKAVEGDSSNIVILKHLGMAYEAAGEQDEALAVYQRGLRLDPQDTELRELVEGLQDQVGRDPRDPAGSGSRTDGGTETP